MGDVHGGHYMAFIKPERGEKWFKFDDDKVTPAIKHEVFDQNFGGDSQNVKTGNRIRRMTNAYMLVYILEDRLDEILSPVTEADIPVHLSEQFKGLFIFSKTKTVKAIDQERIDLEERTKAFKDEQSHIYIKVISVLSKRESCRLIVFPRFLMTLKSPHMMDTTCAIRKTKRILLQNLMSLRSIKIVRSWILRLVIQVITLELALISKDYHFKESRGTLF